MKTDIDVVATGAAVVPMMLAWLLVLLRMPERREAGAVGLAVLWNVVMLLLVNLVAIQAGWWSFGPAEPTLAGMPVGLWFGWVMLWGVVGPLLRWTVPRTLLAFGLLDLVAMPLLQPALVLHDGWLLGEIVLLVVVAAPSLLLAKWTRERSHLAARAWLQMILFSVLLVWFAPLIAAVGSGQSLRPQVPIWAFGVLLGLLLVVVLPGLTAVYDFYLAGGTPWPLDPAERLVRSGPSRYLLSPMQLSGVGLLVLGAAVYRLPLLLLGAAIALAYSAIFCRLEEQDLAERFGDSWHELAQNQRRWIPSVRPLATSEPGTLWVRRSCTPCWKLGQFIVDRHPVALQIRHAEDHRENLLRVRYERADGAIFSGMPAIGAALEHIHLGWAMLGWLLRAPVLCHFFQLVADAMGFGPAAAAPTLETGAV